MAGPQPKSARDSRCRAPGAQGRTRGSGQELRPTAGPSPSSAVQSPRVCRAKPLHPQQLHLLNSALGPGQGSIAVPGDGCCSAHRLRTARPTAHRHGLHSEIPTALPGTSPVLAALLRSQSFQHPLHAPDTPCSASRSPPDFSPWVHPPAQPPATAQGAPAPSQGIPRSVDEPA